MAKKERLTGATVVYHPKGSMCLNCINASRPCGYLEFGNMRVIDSYCDVGGSIQFNIVKCDEFKKTN